MTALLFLLMVAPLQAPAAAAEPAPAALFQAQGDAAPVTERIELRKDGGPGRGFGHSYLIRETGAADLERFVGGKGIIFVGPWDIIALLLIVVLVVVLIIVL